MEPIDKKWCMAKHFCHTQCLWNISEYSHISRRSGKPKIPYPNKKVALRAAEAMGKKHGVHFSVYKCAWCDGWHIGKNAQNKIKSDALEDKRQL